MKKYKTEHNLLSKEEKKILRLLELLHGYERALKISKEYRIQTSKFIETLIKDNRITKEELKLFYKKKKQIEWNKE